MLYRKKIKTVKAIQWTGSNYKTILKEFGGIVKDLGDKTKLYVCTLTGVTAIYLGDYVIKAEENDIYPCKKHIFERDFEEIKDE